MKIEINKYKEYIKSIHKSYIVDFVDVYLERDLYDKKTNGYRIDFVFTFNDGEDLFFFGPIQQKLFRKDYMPTDDGLIEYDKKYQYYDFILNEIETKSIRDRDL